MKPLVASLAPAGAHAGHGVVADGVETAPLQREIARLRGQVAELRMELALVKATAALLVDRGSQSTTP
jgi:hypothetical protein